jgi:hypothetical protein
MRVAGHADIGTDGYPADRDRHAPAHGGAPLADSLRGADDVGAVTDSNGFSDHRRPSNPTPAPHDDGPSLCDTDPSAANA